MQRRSTPRTRYKAVRRPKASDGYPQRIPMWDAVARLGSATCDELYNEMLRAGYKRPKGAKVDKVYCRKELVDMSKRGFLERIEN